MSNSFVIDPDDDEHIRLVSSIFHLPLVTVKQNLQVTRSVINAYEKAKEIQNGPRKE